MEKGLHGCLALTSKIEDVNETQVCILGHSISRNFWIYNYNQYVLWTSSHAFASTCAWWPNLGNCSYNDWNIATCGKLVHFEPINWFLVVIWCIGWCLYLGFQLAEGSPCNGGLLSTFSLRWFWFKTSISETSHDGPSEFLAFA